MNYKSNPGSVPAEQDAKRSTLEAADTLQTATPAPEEFADAANASSSDSAGRLEREAQIRIAAYILAERRGFAPGLDDDDWLEAEQQVDAARQSKSQLAPIHVP
jgi:hypothetical protein